jgi:hypothetical protein
LCSPYCSWKITSLDEQTYIDKYRLLRLIANEDLYFMLQIGETEPAVFNQAILQDFK